MEIPNNADPQLVPTQVPKRKPSRILVVHINRLRVPDWNPRKVKEEAKLLDLMNFIAKGGVVDRLWSWEGESGWAGSAEDLAKPEGEPVDVISGQRRLEALRRLGATLIDVEMFTVTLEEAKDMAVSANVNEDMHWWDWCKAIGERAKAHPEMNQMQLAAHIGVPQTKVNYSKQILEAVNPACWNLLDYCIAIKSDHSYELAERLVFTLTDLNNPKKVIGAGPGLFERALKVVIEHKMIESQAKALIKWIREGHQPEDFKPEAKVRAKKGDKDGKASETKVLTPSEGSEQPNQKLSFIDEVITGVPIIQPLRAKVKAGEKLTKGEYLFLVSRFLWGLLKWSRKASRPLRHGFLHILHSIGKKPAKYFYPLKHSHSSGSGKSSPGLEGLFELLGHGAVYVICQIAFLEFVIWLISIPFPGLKPWWEWLPRFFVHEALVVFPAWAWAYAKANWFPAVIVGLVVIVVLGYAAAQSLKPILLLACFLLLAWYYGKSWSEIPPPWQGHFRQTSSAPIQPANPLPIAAGPPPVKAVSYHPKPIHPVKEVVGQPDASSSSEPAPPILDPQLAASVQEAIAALPVNCVIKPYPVEPDSGIGPLMATNRLGDLAVESEYSLRVGQSGQKITSVTPSATGLVIVAEGGLPLGGLLGDGSKLGFYWEDVQALWCEQLTVKDGDKTKTLYWIIVTATNLNQPLVVQCNTPNNLRHWVSALEYFIKAAQGKTVPVTGMPYLSQGMVLGDEGKITALWAGSPAEQAGLTFADHVWSISGSQRQEKSDLEAALQTLPSGKQTINVVAPKDWDTARVKESKAKNGILQPKLTSFELLVP